MKEKANVELKRNDMLSGITWAEYFKWIGILVAIYYIYIAIRYYPDELKKLLRGGRTQDTSQHTAFAQNFMLDDELQEEQDAYEVDFTSAEEDDFDEVEKLVNALSEVIERASNKNMVVGEFKQFLRMTLREHPTVKNSPFQQSINDLIISECGKYGTYTLSEKEVDVLWNDV